MPNDSSNKRKTLAFFAQSETFSGTIDEALDDHYMLVNSGCMVKKFDGIWILYNLYTPPEFRRKGSARKLVESVMAEFMISNVNLLMARTILNNSPYRLLKSLGFSETRPNSFEHIIQYIQPS